VLDLVTCGITTLALTPVTWLERMPSVCLYWNLLGIHCPGCGMTRAMSALLHADFNRALGYNLLVVVIFPVLAGILLYDTANCLKPPR